MSGVKNSTIISSPQLSSYNALMSSVLVAAGIFARQRFISVSPVGKVPSVIRFGATLSLITIGYVSPLWQCSVKS